LLNLLYQTKIVNPMRTYLILLTSFIVSFSALAQENINVMINTNMGDIVVELYNETPKHRDNFIKLVKSGYLNQTLFHRVIPGFMIQGGDPDSKNALPNVQLGNGGPGYTISAEFNSKFFHKKGALAAARMPDGVNPKKESSGSQFYIVDGEAIDPERLSLFEKKLDVTFTEEQKQAYVTVGGTPHLDGSYTVFGQVIKGFDVISKIAQVKRDQRNRPIEDIIMKVKIIN
jgi:peptidyl-prolyl cis-trans isomerase B (cyclophilin B)